ncbi:MAG: hypothetical protein K9L17_14095 [Clostridiales bacterium]|nr:hypothetical protein [Clostridiales bacterium]MCF8023801.1 hypothetical protein [Clostridiales bacterium]
MSKKFKAYGNIMLALMLSVLLLAVPAMTGFASVELAKNNSKLQYKKLNESAKNSLIKKIIKDKKFKKLTKELPINKFKISNSNAIQWTYGSKKGKVVTITLDSPNKIQILFAKHKNKVKLGAGVFKDIDGEKMVEVYDLVDEKVYNTSTITWENDIPNINWKSGPYASIGKEKQKQDVSTQATSCQICKYVCNAIYSAGCGLTGYFLCNSACAPFGTVACPIICAVVYGVICTTGSTLNCPDMCGDLDYC